MKMKIFKGIKIIENVIQNNANNRHKIILKGNLSIKIQ